MRRSAAGRTCGTSDAPVSGRSALADAHLVDDLEPDDVLTPAEALRDLDQVVVPRDAETQVARGLPLDRVPLGVTGEGPWGLVDGHHRLLAVYEATDTDRIRPAVVVPAGR